MNNRSKIAENDKKAKIIQKLRYKFRNEIENLKLEKVQNKKEILKIKYEKILREIN